MRFHHSKIFLNSIRTALVFIAGFLSYDILKALEITWNNTHENNHIVHFAHRKAYHFIIIFLIDLIILYLVVMGFGIHL
jgi:hypothetical protein